MFLVMMIFFEKRKIHKKAEWSHSSCTALVSSAICMDLAEYLGFLK